MPLASSPRARERGRRSPRLRADRRGLSEIVGALMLVLIVVTAATALAAFVANYQRSSQSEQALAHQRILENLRVIDVSPIPLSTVVATVTNSSLSGAHLTVNAGTAGSVSGNGFNPGDSITLTFGGAVISNCISGTGLVATGGAFSCVFVIPHGLAGPTAVRSFDSSHAHFLNVTADLAEQTTLSEVHFTLASLYIDSSTITGISLNGEPLSQFCVDPPSSPPPSCVNSVSPAMGQSFAVGSQQQLVISANVTADSPYDSSFFYHPASISGTSFLKIEIFTALGNDFIQSFVPPTAIALVDTIQTANGLGGFTTIPILDGSLSIQPGNETIVTWSWSIDETPRLGGSTTPLSNQVGEKVAEPGFNATAFEYSITLTVTDNDGLFGVATVSYPG